MTNKTSAKDRHFAVICFAVQLENCKDVDLALAEIYSEAITTKSRLLVHHVLINIPEGRGWRRFCNEVKRYIAERATI
jgi:hypothetical protein